MVFHLTPLGIVYKMLLEIIFDVDDVYTKSSTPKRDNEKKKIPRNFKMITYFTFLII